VKPPRTLVLSEEKIEHVTSIAALWIQKINKENSHIAKFMRSGWTNGRLPNQNITFTLMDKDYKVDYKSQRDDSFLFNSNKVAKIYDGDEFGIDVEFDGKRAYSRITLSENKILVHMPYGDVMLEIKPRFVIPGLEIQAGGLIAPMPGKVIDLKVKKGNKVKVGDTLIVLEAMKMEHSIKASEDGVVSELLVSTNDQVENGALLMVVKPK
jgi:propionyl-CoA carboxylase alpha chain